MGGAPRSRTPALRDREPGGGGAPVARHGLRAYLATRALPWFGLGALLVVVGSVGFHDPMESYLVVAGVFVLVAACIRYSVLAVRDDPLRSLMVARRGLLGWMATENATGRRRRARRRATTAQHEDAEMHYEAPPNWK
jgi:hypothetical protein